jgi:hypothetical protein
LRRIYDMPYAGTIVSHDLSLHTGLVLPDGNEQAIAFTEGDVLNWQRTAPLFGQRVSFEVVQTPHGYAAVQMFLLEQKKPRSLESRDFIAALITPLLVAGTTYALSHYLRVPLIFAYIPTINFVSFMMMLLVSQSSRGQRPRLAEFMVVTLAFCGGAPAIWVAVFFSGARLRSEGMFLLMAALVVMQAIALKKYFPEVFDWHTWAYFFLKSEVTLKKLPPL